MSAPVFLVAPGTLQSVGAVITLDGPEGRHAATVKRMRVGERIELVDGRGRRAVSTVIDVGKQSVDCMIDALQVDPAPSPHVTVVQALAKGERADLAVELMTEAGVNAIVPWSASRSIARWDADKATKGVARWESIAREAAKQSRRSWVPEVAALASTAEVCTLVSHAQLVVVLHEEASTPIANLEVGPVSVVVVVGPEGGISPEEIEALSMASEVAPVRLGPEVVRTSTAGALAAAVLLARTPRWGVAAQGHQS